MTSSKALLFFLLSFIGGVFISSFFNVPWLIICELFFLAVFYSIVFFKHKAVVVFGICLIIFGLGICRFELTETRSLSLTESGSLLAIKPLSFLKQRLRAVINQSLSPPQSQILGAVLLGDKQNISKEWKEKLNTAGVRHITAVSGMHIVILSSILLWLGVVLGFYRGKAFYFAIIVLWLFILMLGFQPSAIRAGIMGTLLLFCEKIGRQKSADRALVLTAAVMLAIHPSLLRYNVGFQLSFLATLGIIYLMPLFQNLFSKLKLRRPGLRSLTDLLTMTFAAQVFTLPILIYTFGYVSLASPITNVLIVPLLPYLMGAGFIFLITGAIWQLLGLIFLLPVWLMLTYITKIVDLFAGFSFSSISLQIHWFWLPVVYSLLVILLWQIKKRTAKIFP